MALQISDRAVRANSSRGREVWTHPLESLSYQFDTVNALAAFLHSGSPGDSPPRSIRRRDSTATEPGEEIDDVTPRFWQRGSGSHIYVDIS